MEMTNQALLPRETNFTNAVREMKRNKKSSKAQMETNKNTPIVPAQRFQNCRIASNTVTELSAERLEDDDAYVSGLSEDDEYLNFPRHNKKCFIKQEFRNTKEFSPPIEISFHRSWRMEDLIANLERKSSASKEIIASKSSQNLKYPTLNRHISRPTAAGIPIASKSLFSHKASGIPENSIIASLYDTVTIQNKSIKCRKRQIYRRCHPTERVRAGCIVDESTLLNERSNTSVTDSEESSVHEVIRSLHSTPANNLHRIIMIKRPTNRVKEEFKCAVGVVPAPVRLLAIFKGRKVELHRSKGRLV